MSVSSLNLSSVLSYALTATGIFSSAATTPGSAVTWSLSGLDVSIWDYLYLAKYVFFITAPTGVSSALTTGGTLSSGQAYYYKVTGTGPYGTQITDTTESGPSSETTKTATGATLSITITWTALQGATGYKIYRGTTTGSENLLVGTITSGSTVTFTDTGVAGTSASPPSAPAAYVEFDLSSFTDQLNTAVTPLHALALVVIPTGTSATCLVAPGTTNGLTWFFSGTTPGLNLTPGGIAVISGPVGAASVGGTIDSTHKTLRITAGTANLTVTVGIPVSST